MADFDFSTLITDRSSSDLELLRDLLSTPMGDWTAEQLAAFNQAISKGAYNYTDLNRVTQCMDYLNERLTEAGYATGYHPIIVHPEEPPEPVGPLPDGYTELEYIQSSGEQYIDTGVSPNQDTRITMTAMLTEAPSEFAAFFGARTGGNSQFWLFWNENSNIFQGRYGTATIDISVSAQQECVCDFNKNNLSINGTSGYAGAATFQSSYSAYLCGVNSSGALQYPASIRIYSCEIYNDGTLVRTFVPVKNEAGAVGLYDTTGKSFYANAGSGSFTAGPEVPPPEPEPTLDPYTWYEADIPTVSTMEAYLGNVSALRSVLTLPGGTAQAPGDMAGLTTTEANQIEEILSVIGAYLEAMITVFRRCGAAICGGPGFYFVN